MTKRPAADVPPAGQIWVKDQSSYMGTGYNPRESLLFIDAVGATLAPIPSETNGATLTLDQCIKHISRITKTPDFESGLLDAGREVVSRFYEFNRMEGIWRGDGYDEEVIKDHFEGPLADLKRDAHQLLNKFELEVAKMKDSNTLRDLNKSIRALPDTVSSEIRCELYRQVANIAGQLGSIPLHIKSIPNDPKLSPDEQQILHELARKRTLQEISSLQREIKIFATKMPVSMRIEPRMTLERETLQSAQSDKVDQAQSHSLMTRATVNRLAKRVSDLEIDSVSHRRQAVTSQITLEQLLKRVAKLEIQLRDIYSVRNGHKSATTPIICGGIGTNTTSKATKLEVEDTASKAIGSIIETILQEKDEGAKNAPQDTTCQLPTSIMSSCMPRGPTPTLQTTGFLGWTDDLLSDLKQPLNLVHGVTQDSLIQAQSIRFWVTQAVARHTESLRETAADLTRLGYSLRVKEEILARHENAITAWSRNTSSGVTFKENDIGVALTGLSMSDFRIKTIAMSAKQQMAELDRKALLAMTEIEQLKKKELLRAAEMKQQAAQLTQQPAPIDRLVRDTEHHVREMVSLKNTIQTMVDGIALRFKGVLGEFVVEKSTFAERENGLEKREKELAAREQRVAFSEKIVRARLANVAAYHSKAMEITIASVRGDDGCGMSRKGWSDVQKLIQGVKGLDADGDNEEIKSIRRLAESVEREVERMLWRKKDGMWEIDTEELAAAMKQEDEKILAESKADDQEEITGALQQNECEKLAAIPEDNSGQPFTGAPKHEAEEAPAALGGEVDKPTTPIDDDIDIVLVTRPSSP